MTSSWLKWLHLGGFSTNYALSLDRTISVKQFLPVNLQGTFDTAAAISAQGSHFDLGISFLRKQTPRP
jgi:hypothetical protein